MIGSPKCLICRETGEVRFQYPHGRFRRLPDLGDKPVDVTLGTRIRISVNEYRVTKYNPALRDHSGAYTRVEWVSITQIGQTFSGVLLTADEYERVEEAYVQAALSFLRESGLSSVRVAGLENH